MKKLWVKIAQENRQKLPCGAGLFPAFDTKLLCGVKQAISCRYQSDTESQIGLEGTFKDQLVPTPCYGQEYVCLLWTCFIGSWLEMLIWLVYCWNRSEVTVSSPLHVGGDHLLYWISTELEAILWRNSQMCWVKAYRDCGRFLQIEYKAYIESILKENLWIMCR